MNEQMLEVWEEAVGTLTGIKDDCFIITLEFTTVWKVEVPRISKDLIKKFDGMIGKHIGVLRTDLPGREILLREDKIVEKEATYE